MHRAVVYFWREGHRPTHPPTHQGATNPPSLPPRNINQPTNQPTNQSINQSHKSTNQSHKSINQPNHIILASMQHTNHNRPARRTRTRDVVRVRVRVEGVRGLEPHLLQQLHVPPHGQVDRVDDDALLACGRWWWWCGGEWGGVRRNGVARTLSIEWRTHATQRSNARTHSRGRRGSRCRSTTLPRRAGGRRGAGGAAACMRMDGDEGERGAGESRKNEKLGKFAEAQEGEGDR